MFEKEMKKLIGSGKIKIIDLPTKREEIRGNQISLLNDDLDNAETLFGMKKFRGAYIHAFDALERIIDVVLIEKGYKASDRYARRIAIGNVLGKEFLEKYENLFGKRKDGMYDTYGIISEHDSTELLEEMIPKLAEDFGIAISKTANKNNIS